MGIFDRKTVITVSAASNRIYDDLPERRKQAVIQAVLSNASIPNALTSVNLSGGRVSLKNMARYATSGDYIYGAPDASISNNLEEQPKYLEEVLLLEPNIELYEVPSTGTYGVEYTVDIILHNEEYVASEGVPPQTEIDKANIYQVYKYYQNFPNWDGNTHIFEGKLITATFDNYEQADVYEDGVLRETIGIVDPYKSPLHTCRYYWEYIEYTWGDVEDVSSGTTSWEIIATNTYYTTKRYFVYNEFTGAYPQINVQVVTKITEELFPIIPIKSNFVYTSDREAIRVNNVNKMLKLFPIELSKLEEAIKDNPDESLVQDAHIYWGLNTTTNELWNITGLFYTLQVLYNNALYTTDNGLDTNQLLISEETFDYGLEFQYIEYFTEPGSGWSMGYYDYGNVVIPDSGIVDQFDGSVGANQTWQNDVLFVRRDSQTEAGLVDVFVIHGMTTRHLIKGAGEGLTQLYRANDVGCLLPLMGAVVDKVPSKYRDDVVYGSAHLVTYAVDRQKLEWYETFLFKVIMIAASVAFAFISPAGSALIAGITAGGTAALMALVSALSIYLVVDYAAQWLVEQFGALGIVLAVALMLASGGKIASLSSNLADTLMSSFSSAIRATTMYTTSQYEETLRLTAGFKAAYDDRLEEIEELRERLDYGADLNMLDVVVRSLPNIDVNESPQDFYKRTSNHVNLPDLTNGMVTSYYKSGRTLPKADSYAGVIDSYNPNGGFQT